MNSSGDTANAARPLRLPRRLLVGATIALGCAQLSTAQDFDRLSKELTSGDRDARREAAFELRELGAASLPALPALIEALGDDDEQVAARAVTAIARIGPKASGAIPTLIERMDPDRRRYNAQVVFRSAYALSEIGAAAITPLREALKDSSEHRRAGAALALQLIGPPAAPAIPELVTAVHDGEPEVRRAAAEALAAIGEAAVEPLRRDLEQSPSPAAVQAIGLIGKPAMPTADPLFELLAADADNAALRAATITALGAIEAPFDRLKLPLRDALSGDSEGVRRAAASVLLTYPQPQEHSFPALREWLADPDAELSASAARVVGQFGGDAATMAPAVIERLGQSDQTQAFAAALADLGPAATGAILDAVAKVPVTELMEEGHWARTIVRSPGALALPALEAGLDSEHASARFLALSALANLGKLAEPLAPKLRRACNDPEAAVRLAALLALDSSGADPQRLSVILRRRCDDESGEVRAVALRMLAKSAESDPSTFDLVDAALADPEPAVRGAAIGALTNFGAQAAASLPQLQQLAEGADEETALLILNAITAIGAAAADALPVVRESLDSPNPKIRGAAVSALVAVQQDGAGLTELLSGMLQDDNQAVRHPAIAGLGAIGEPARPAAPKLFALLGNGDDRDQALEALRQIGSRDVELYISALDNPEPRVRLFACEALGRIGPEAEKAIPRLEKARRDRYDFVRRRADDAIRRIRG